MKQPRWTLAGGLLALLALPAITGCGNGLANVSGTVTVDGQPLSAGNSVSGVVQLFPESGTGAIATGQLDEDGSYSVSTGSQRGVKPGAYVVTIAASEIIPAKQPGAAPSGRPILPRRYNNPKASGLRVEVANGSNSFDFDLESEPQQTASRRRR